MGVACDVYTKLLFKRGHGHPLWEPEPTQAGEVLIGDVGYMLDGGFYRLFNATLPADDPLHERHGVPEGYEPLTFPDTLRHHRPHALQAGPICSKSVTAVNADASVEPGTGSFGPLAHVRFKFSDEQGAVLVLEHDAHREALHPCRDLTQYVLRNHAAWHAFARNVCRLDLRAQDLVFVCGWVKTAAWALAAATHRARDGEIAFGADLGPGGQASFSVAAAREVSMSWEHRRGPKGGQREGEGPAKFDQCVFLHYYKIKHRPFFVPKVIRGATEEEHSSRSSSPNGSDHMAFGEDEATMSQVEVVPKPTEQGDMVDAMLDYILDQTDATCAIVSDRDIAMLSNADGIPDSLSQLLSSAPPTLTVTGGVGMLPCHNAALDSAAHIHGRPLPTIPPMVQFSVGPPRVLPHYRVWSAARSRSRSQRSRSRSQSTARALSPPSAPPIAREQAKCSSHMSKPIQDKRRAPMSRPSLAQYERQPPVLGFSSRSSYNRPGEALASAGSTPQSSQPRKWRLRRSPPVQVVPPGPVRRPRSEHPPSPTWAIPNGETSSAYRKDRVRLSPSPTYERLAETPFVSSESWEPVVFDGDDDDFLFSFSTHDDGEWEEAQLHSSAGGPSSAGAPALPSPSLSSLLTMDEFDPCFARVEGSALQLVGKEFEGGCMGGADGDVPLPARLEPDGLPMGNSIALSASVHTSKGKGKGKEVARPKRTRSPSDDGEDGEDEDERPAKRSRKE